ncbi:MAG: exonuclease SbcCD subunit D C-terminal domain-containing protein [Desulfotalea sp.]
MKFLHTSDWHLGKRLYGRDRQDEFVKFLDWLDQIIIEENIDVLLVAGDIFDTTLASNKAQKLYYKFLFKVATGSCKHVIIIAGNHDSPSFLNAPKDLLKALDVHIISSKTDELEDEIICLTEDGVEKAVICAIPYLRDRDVRRVVAGESIDDKQHNLISGIEDHYQQVTKLALEKKGTKSIPIIGMGHLFTMGGKTIDNDGVRDLYVGNLVSVNAKNIANGFDYLALGHLHVPQIVAKKDNIRYSGSPIPIGFGEAKQEKEIIIFTFASDKPLDIKVKNVPVFQKLQAIKGSLEQIKKEISIAKDKNESIWLEIEYTDKTPEPNLREEVEQAVKDSDLEVRIIKNQASRYTALKSDTKENLSDIEPEEVFKRCLENNEIEGEKIELLQAAYKEILQNIYEES